MPEIEIRGVEPFSTSILYEDLMSWAARVGSGTKLVPSGLVVSRLRPQASCFTCEYASGWFGGWRDDESRERHQRVIPLSESRLAARAPKPLAGNCMPAPPRRWRARLPPAFAGGREPDLERGELRDKLSRASRGARAPLLSR